MAHELLVLTARWIFPVDRPPLANGTVTIQAERIQSIDIYGARAPDVDLGNAAILPGLVNAHTHLDLSDALGKCPPSSEFTDWLRAVVTHRRSQTAQDVARAIDAGLAQCRRFGSTLVGDISSGGDSWLPLSKAPLRSVVFFELLGLTAAAADRASRQAQAGSTIIQPRPPRRPASVRMRLTACACLFEEIARSNFGPICTHIAETEAELELLRSHQGPLRDFLIEMNAWDPEGLAADLAQVAGPLSKTSALLVHGNYLPSSIDMRGRTLVFCPRTHAAFGHRTHPFRDLQANGCRVVLGTDSLASNPDLDVLAEARFLRHQFPDLGGETILKMATLDGAIALGWGEQTGSLAPGKSADLVVLPLPNGEAADPHDLVLDSKAPIHAVMFKGEWL